MIEHRDAAGSPDVGRPIADPDAPGDAALTATRDLGLGDVQ